MQITYVTGVSASGKSTLATNLINDGVPNVQELDGYSGGLPNAAHGEWLLWRAAELLHEATEEAGDDEHRVVTGIVLPFSLINMDAWDAALDAGVTIRFVLLDRPWSDVETSMTERLGFLEWDPQDINEQLVLNCRQHARLRRQVKALSPTYGTVIPDGDLSMAQGMI